jgi:hypothetical protein
LVDKKGVIDQLLFLADYVADPNMAAELMKKSQKFRPVTG